MERKSLTQLSWQVTEPQYRQDPALSQSTLGKYEREGFEHLDTLFDHIDTPSLTFGSAVDSIITGGEKEFMDRFFVSDMLKVSSTAEPIIKEIYNRFHSSYTNINDIPESELMPILSQMGYKGNTNWGVKAKCDAIRKDGGQYYQTMFMAKGKTVLPQETYNKIFACVRALKDSPQTHDYFCEDNPFDNIERYYQLKFKDTLDGVDYRGMLDLVIVDHNRKIVIPCDLKTSSKREFKFFKSFIEYGYSYQARLYWRLLRRAMDRDDYYKDFKLLDFRFIVVNTTDVPQPLVWEFDKTQATGTLTLGNYTLRDPEEIGKELSHYLEERPKVPDGIKIKGTNSITWWLENAG